MTPAGPRLTTRWQPGLATRASAHGHRSIPSAPCGPPSFPCDRGVSPSFAYSPASRANGPNVSITHITSFFFFFWQKQCVGARFACWHNLEPEARRLHPISRLQRGSFCTRTIREDTSARRVWERPLPSSPSAGDGHTLRAPRCPLRTHSRGSASWVGGRSRTSPLPARCSPRRHPRGSPESSPFSAAEGLPPVRGSICPTCPGIRGPDCASWSPRLHVAICPSCASPR